MANSINISETKVKTKMATSGIDRYSTFGLRDKWISDFFENDIDFFIFGIKYMV